MKINMAPIEDLKYARDQLALEFFSTAPATNFLKSLMPGIINAFSSADHTPDLPVLTPLSKDQSKFNTVLKDIPFTEIGELRAYTPEGMNKKYLEYLAILLPVTANFKKIQNEVMQPYTLFLAQLVSDKNASISTNSKKTEYDKMEKTRDAIYSEFSKCYDKDSYKAETIVKRVVDRNADWLPVFNMINECIMNVKAVDRELLKRQVHQCVDYLDIIKDNLDKEQMANTSREAAAYLSNGAYNVAKELEALSTTYYRVLALNGSIENTVNHILKTVG